ncbi:pyruvate formate-lyase 1-activating enzyme [Clostridium sp. CAG:793]|nr:pyruvate formate-lyase 1-activating enzyme [Clostridium sp. CAG:793]
MLKGRIHSFESFGAVDGPGIRYIVFMQGCHLKCKYCQNRDTWDVSSPDSIECTTDEVLNKILKYKNYIKASDGGVTISGGEPLLQPDFLIELFTKLHDHGISTCIDTSGMFPLTDKIKKVIDVTDIFLLDIKCINDDICTWLTGHSNKLELEFARYISNCGKRLWIRQVLVPGITDKESDLVLLRDFLKTINVEKFEFLGYHDLGKYKWEKLGLKYELENTPIATKDDLDRAYSIINS